MPDKKEISYVGEAFKVKGNLLLLLGGLLGAILVKGIATLPALGAVLVLEALYLLGMSTNKRFRLIARSRRDGEERIKLRRRLESDLFRMNHNPYRDRYAKLRKNIDNIKRHFARKGQDNSLITSTVGNLEKLQNQFLSLVFSHHFLNRYLNEVSEGKIERDIKKLEEELATARDGVKEIKQQRLEILKKRASKIDTAEKNLEVVANQLEMIHETVSYLMEQTITAENTEKVSREIEKITVQAESANQTLTELEDFIDFSQPFGESDIVEMSSRIRNL